MAELICTYCGTSNDVHSEYLILCAGCGKKLKGSFPEWKKENPRKSFKEYLDQLAATGRENQKRKADRSVSRIRARIAGVVTTLLVLAMMTGGYLYITGVWKPFQSNMYTTPKEILKKDWKRYTLGRSGLSVELPGKPEKASEVTGDYPDAEQFVYHPDKGFQAELTGIQKQQGVIGLEEAATEALNSIMNIPGVSNVNYQAAPLESGDVPGVLLSGTLEEEGSVLHFHCAVFVKSSNSWKVVVRHLSGDPVGEECAGKIISSIDINYFGSPV